jgi:hypothetical protein
LREVEYSTWWCMYYFRITGVCLFFVPLIDI